MFSKIVDREFYVYRKNLGYWQSVYSPKVIIDGQQALFPKEGYAVVSVKPGEYKVLFQHHENSGYPDTFLILSAEEEKQYFIRLDDPTAGFDIPAPGVALANYQSTMKLLPSDIGLRKLRPTRAVRFGLIE